ncbi:type 4a pilus biogenesis protein PilO [Stratiformator vulcanicus]|uniref:Pilus assembly protein, PilO n=1 Tax=Stratiformator vulcanicus TaxID=2527980 RepID=A0A517R515_9PLAN|nr:type 4a pilus biogenesis protein PilO [Stratiformator vulcanicus]QDT38977.1 Pilus assembly protein, PilO [Stratiformator vulcanicus]
MIAGVRKDSFKLIVALILMGGAFIYFVYLPYRQVAARLHSAVEAARTEIALQPTRRMEINELSENADDLRRRLSDGRTRIPASPRLHEVVAQVSGLALQHEVLLLRLSPGDPIEHETYSEYPYAVEFRGTFTEISRWLRALEQETRLYDVRSISMEKAENRKSKQATEGALEGKLEFTVFAADEGNSESDEDRLDRAP